MTLEERANLAEDEPGERDDLWAEVDALLFDAGDDDTEAPPSRSWIGSCAPVCAL